MKKQLTKKKESKAKKGLKLKLKKKGDSEVVYEGETIPQEIKAILKKCFCLQCGAPLIFKRHLGWTIRVALRKTSIGTIEKRRYGTTDTQLTCSEWPEHTRAAHSIGMINEQILLEWVQEQNPDLGI